MTTPKLRDNDLVRLQQEAEQKVKEKIFRHPLISHWLGAYYRPDLSLSQIIEASGQKNNLRFQADFKRYLRDMLDIWSQIEKFQEYATALEPFFEGSWPNSSLQAQQALKNFVYYNKMTIEAFRFFSSHLGKNDSFFSADIYRQWLACAKLGLYTAPDFVVLGKYGLNYSDNRDPSPRLEKLKLYLEHVYRCRFIIKIFDEQLTTWSNSGDDSYSMSMQTWSEFLAHTRQQLGYSFSAERAAELFRQIFGSDNPDQPATAQLFQAYQQQVLDRIALALLPNQPNQPNNPPPSGMNRDYVAEERAREARINEERARRERERQERANQPPPIPNQSETPERGRTRSPSPPRQNSFNNSTLNDIINSMNNALSEDSQAQGHDQGNGMGQGGSGGGCGFDGSLNSIMKEDAIKLPWLVMGINFQDNYWKVKDPATFATFRHYQDSIITLCLTMFLLNSSNYSNVLHNFFWVKSHDQKGFNCLLKDTEPAKEGEGETKLLIAGERKDDLRAEKLGWDNWPWGENGRIVDFGVSGVRQKENAIIRNFRNQAKAYDLDDQNHFIGILRARGVMSKEAGTFRTIGWGSAPKKSVLYITNQMSYPWAKDSDWWDDNIKTINSDKEFSHYLIFSDHTTEEINEKFIQNNPNLTLAQLVGKLQGTLVRLGPDVLELMDVLTPAQKERAQDETKESREKNKAQITEQNLKDIGLTQEDWKDLTTAFTDPAKIANIIKKLASCDNPAKVAEFLDRMFDHLQPPTAENMFKQMVNNNPVFNQQEKEVLIKAYQAAKTKEDKKKVWQSLTSGARAQAAHAKKSSTEKEQIFRDQVNNNPRYGSPNTDTQERRDRLNEPPNQQLQQEENSRFTTGENAHQWANYFQDNAQYEAGAGDRSVGTESDNNFNGQFSFADSLQAINKLKNIGSMKPAGMEEGMVANKPYWQVVMSHPLTYIFLFIGIVIAIMAAATKKR